MSTLYNRKEFLQKLIGRVKSNEENHSDEEQTGLSSEKLAFLKEYTSWLNDFEKYVEKRQSNVLNSKHNQTLMRLASSIEKSKPTLEKYMEDPIFAKHFEELTRKISENIS